MKFKKWMTIGISLMTAACMLFSFAACDDKPIENPDDDSGQVDPLPDKTDPKPNENQGEGLHRPGTNVNPDAPGSSGSSSSEEEHEHYEKQDVDKPGVDLPNGLILRVKYVQNEETQEEVATNEYYVSDGYKCTEETVEIPAEYEGKKITSIGPYAFEDSTVKKVIVPEGVVEIGANAFSFCPNLTEVEVRGNTLKVIGSTAFKCSGNFKTINLPDGLTTIGDYAFIYCVSIETLPIPANTLDLGYGIFLGCSGLKEFTIPSTWTTIPGDMFANCNHLAEVTIPEGITELGFEAFYGCKSFEKITIPVSVTSLCEACFMACTNLVDIYYMGTSAEWMEIEKGVQWDYESRGVMRAYKLHCSDEE